MNKYAPLKKKVLCANHMLYVTKALKKAIMKRSYLETLHFKKQDSGIFEKYKNHKKFCSSL